MQTVSYISRAIVCSWFTFTLLMTSAYSGNLRALLLRPVPGNTVDTVPDVVGSGLPWKVVVYGGWLENVVANMKDPVVQEYWKDKVALRPAQIPFQIVRSFQNGLYGTLK